MAKNSGDMGQNKFGSGVAKKMTCHQSEILHSLILFLLAYRSSGGELHGVRTLPPQAELRCDGGRGGGERRTQGSR